MEPADRLLTPQDVASRLGIKLGTVYALGRNGKIPGVVRIARLMRFRPEALEEWIRDGGTSGELVA